MVKRCQWGLCNSDSRYPDRLDGGKIQFIPFPKPRRSLEKCIRWIKACGRPHEQLNVNKVDGNKHMFVCSKHFPEEMPTEMFPDPLPANIYDASNCTRARRPPRKRANSGPRPKKRKILAEVTSCYENQQTTLEVVAETDPDATSALTANTQSEDGSSEAYPRPLKMPEVRKNIASRNTENFTDKLCASSKGMETYSLTDHICIYGYIASDKQNFHQECKSNLSKDLLLTRKNAAVKTFNQKSHYLNETETVGTNQKQSGSLMHPTYALWKCTPEGQVYMENDEKSVDSRLNTYISANSKKDCRTIKENLKDKVSKSHDDQLLHKKTEVDINKNKTGQEDICMPSKLTKYNEKHSVCKVKSVKSFDVDVIKDTQQERQSQLVPEREMELGHKKLLVLFSVDKNKDGACKHDVSDYSELYVNGHVTNEKVKPTPVYLVPNKHYIKCHSRKIPFEKKTENEKVFQNDNMGHIKCFQPDESSELFLPSVYFGKEVDITSQSIDTHNICEEEFMNSEQNDKSSNYITSQSTDTHNVCKEEFMNLEQNDESSNNITSQTTDTHNVCKEEFKNSEQNDVSSNYITSQSTDTHYICKEEFMNSEQNDDSSNNITSQTTDTHNVCKKEFKNPEQNEKSSNYFTSYSTDTHNICKVEFMNSEQNDKSSNYITSQTTDTHTISSR